MCPCGRATLSWILAHPPRLVVSVATRLLATPLPASEEAALGAVREVRTLLRDTQKRVAEVKRSNKRLARELSEWVTLAMELGGQEVMGRLSLS